LRASFVQVLAILKPVAVTMMLVIWVVKTITIPYNQNFSYALDALGAMARYPCSTHMCRACARVCCVVHDASPVYMVYKEVTTDDTSTKLLGALLNALVFVVIIVIVTVIFVILYKYRCLKVSAATAVVPPFSTAAHECSSEDCVLMLTRTFPRPCSSSSPGSSARRV
jgi:hypothetical protein